MPLDQQLQYLPDGTARAAEADLARLGQTMRQSTPS